MRKKHVYTEWVVMNVDYDVGDSEKADVHGSRLWKRQVKDGERRRDQRRTRRAENSGVEKERSVRNANEAIRDSEKQMNVTENDE